MKCDSVFYVVSPVSSAETRSTAHHTILGVIDTIRIWTQNEHHHRVRSPNDYCERRLRQSRLLDVFSLASVSMYRWKYMVIALIVTLVVILVSVFFGKR